MGANASKTVAEMTTQIDNTLQQQGFASAKTDCSITTGNIILGPTSHGITINNINRCTATASAAMDAAAQAATDAVMKLSNDQKTSLPLIGVNVNDTSATVKSKISQTLSQQCQSDASAALSIATKDIIVNGYNSTINNINTGDVVGNCAIRAVMDTAEKAGLEATNTQSTGEANLLGGLGGLFAVANAPFISGSSLIFCCCCCICLIVIMLAVSGMGGSKNGSSMTPGGGTETVTEGETQVGGRGKREGLNLLFNMLNIKPRR